MRGCLDLCPLRNPFPQCSKYMMIPGPGDRAFPGAGPQGSHHGSNVCTPTHVRSHACSHTCAHTCMYTHTHTHEGLVAGRSDGNTGQRCPGKSGLVAGWGWPGLGPALPLPSLCPRWSLRRQGAHRVRIWSPNQGFESHLWPGDGRGPSACPAGAEGKEEVPQAWWRIPELRRGSVWGWTWPGPSEARDLRAECR